MKQYYCLDCNKPKSAYGLRCHNCARIYTFSDPNSQARKNMSDAHKGNIPTNLAQLQLMLKGNKYCTGRTPWNKGLKGINEGDKNPLWKGDKVSYRSLHKWVDRKLGQPQQCVSCNDTSKHRYHWANISHEYKRDVNDWIRLCPKCHKSYDTNKLTLMQLVG